MRDLSEKQPQRRTFLGTQRFVVHRISDSEVGAVQYRSSCAEQICTML